jgi:glucose-1-phosphate adenylyltransferase
MGIYVFNVPELAKMLTEDAHNKDSVHDFGKNIIPRMVAEGKRVFAYPFGGYWVDVGTIDSYWHAHMDLLKQPPVLNLNDRSWIVHTRSEERPPVFIQHGAKVIDSLVTDGSIIAPGATVERSILSPGVYVGPLATVRDSIILTEATIEAGATVERCIIDKKVAIGHNARIGRLVPDAADLGITTIGKGTQVPGGMVIGRNVHIGSDVAASEFPTAGLPDNTTLNAKQ